MKSLQYDSNHPFYELLKVFEEFEKTPMMIHFNKKQKREERIKKLETIIDGDDEYKN